MRSAGKELEAVWGELLPVTLKVGPEDTFQNNKTQVVLLQQTGWMSTSMGCQVWLHSYYEEERHMQEERLSKQSRDWPVQ